MSPKCIRGTVEERLIAYSDRSGGPDACWPWMRSRDQCGYGWCSVRAGKAYKAHRLSYERTVGPIPDGMEVCHTCDNPPCINPAHLFVATHADNIRDSNRKGRGRGRLTDDDVLRIRHLLTLGRRQVDIAEAFGVNQTTISAIKVGKNWSHLHASGPPIKSS